MGRRRVAVAMVVAIVAAAVLPLLGAAPAGAVLAPGTTVSTVALTTPRSMFVDPPTGRVFVSGDDSVLVYAPDGSLVSTITGIPGAAGMTKDPANGLWVAESTGSALARIDLATLAIDAVYPQSTTVGSSIAIARGAVWYTTPTALGRFDLTSHAISRRGSIVQGATELVAIPGAPTRLLAHASDSGNTTLLLDLTVNPVAPLASRSGFVTQLGVTPDGSKAIVASNWLGTTDEVTTTALAETGVAYPGDPGMMSIATSPGRGGLVAAASSQRTLYVAQTGTPISTHVLPLPASPVTRMLGLSPDGTRAHVVTADGATKQLATIALAPTVSAAVPSSVVAGVPTTVTVTGTGLGRITSATVGGLSATAAAGSATRVDVTMPVGLTVGPQTIVLTTAFGSASTSVTVTPNTGATITGIVRSGTTPVAGLSTTLSGGGLGAAKVATTDANGRYTITGVPYGSTYALAVHPSIGPDQTIRNVTLAPNTTRTVDVTLAAPPSSTIGVIAQATLPTGPIRKTVADPATGSVFVSVGDEVAVLDHDGNLRSRILHQPAAQGLAIGGGTLYVNTRTRVGERDDVSTVTTIDTATLAVTGRIPTDTVTDGELAFAANKIIYTVGNDQHVTLRAYDVTTHAVTQIGNSWYVPLLGPVDGSSNLFLIWGLSGLNVADAATGAVRPTVARGFGPGVASATSGKLWSGLGIEYDLATMAPNGITYPSSAPPFFEAPTAFSPGHGGVFALGRTLATVGTPTSVADLPEDPTTVALDAAGGRAFYTTTDNRFVTFDPSPTIATIAPTAVVAGVPTSVAVTGTGLGRVTTATVGGLAAAVAVTSTTQIQVTMPAGLTAGPKALALTTPFGTVTGSVTATANGGATLTGTVRWGATPQPGVTVTLSGGGLAAPRVTTTGATGTYAIAGVPYGTTYQVVAHPATGEDRTVRSIALTPNGTTTLDVDLAGPPPGTPGVLADRTLPAGTVRKLIADAATGTVFVSVGNEVDAFDRNGNLLRRFSNQFAAQGLAIGGSTLYVNARTTGSITTIDIPSLTITGSIPTSTPTDGELAYGAGKLVYTTGDDQWVGLTVLDLAARTTVDIPGSWYVPLLYPVDGSTSQIMAKSNHYAYPAVLIDLATTTVLGSDGLYGREGMPVATTSVAKGWQTDGSEFALPSMVSTGVHYPVSDALAAAVSPAANGTLAIGRNVFSIGTLTPSHTLPRDPSNLWIDRAGDRLFATTSDGHLVVADLEPQLVSTSTAPVYSDGGTLRFTGTGLGVNAGVKLDGVTVASTTIGTDRLDVVVPPTTAGTHTITVVTPWGTASRSFTTIPRPSAPTVTGLSPASVTTAGGTVTITGTSFTTASSVTFAGFAPTSFTVVNATTITAVVPANSPIAGSVVVTNPGGTNSSSPVFSWVAPAPAVTSIAPNHGPSVGGTTVTIHGSGFLFASEVAFGSTPSPSFVVTDDSTIQAASPGGAIGPTDIRVTTAGGTSPSTAAGTFTFDRPLPTVSQITPNTGSALGGYQVTIKGANLTGTTGVSFGTVPATGVVVVDDATVLAIVPAQAPGVVNVTITTPSGQNIAPSLRQFRYTPPPTASISGTVSSMAGPLPNMLVVVSSPATFSVVTSAWTQADGTFRIDNLAPGPYKVLTMDPGTIFGATDAYVAQFYDGGGADLGAFASATTVNVANGATLTLNPITLAYNHPGAVSARVTNGTVPLANEVVFVSRSSSLAIVAYGVTDASGNVTIAGLAPGTYRVGTFDGATLFGVPATYAPQLYRNKGSDLTAVAAATPVVVAKAVTTVLDPIVLTHV